MEVRVFPGKNTIVLARSMIISIVIGELENE